MMVSFRKVMGFALVALPLYAAAQVAVPQAATPAPVVPGPTATAGSQAATAPETPAAPVQAPAAAQPGAPLQSSATYVIGADDSLQIVVWHEERLSGSFPVRPDGMISIPLVGDVTASGKTAMDLAKDLTDRLKKFITDPTVSVSVMAVNSKRIFMIGEIAKIGPVPLTTEMTPLQAIASAGGLGPYANKKKIYILRIVNGKQTKIHFDYKKALNGIDQGEKLIPGDTIVIP